MLSANHPTATARDTDASRAGLVTFAAYLLTFTGTAWWGMPSGDGLRWWIASGALLWWVSAWRSLPRLRAPSHARLAALDTTMRFLRAAWVVAGWIPWHAAPALPGWWPLLGVGYLLVDGLLMRRHGRVSAAGLAGQSVPLLVAAALQLEAAVPAALAVLGLHSVFCWLALSGLRRTGRALHRQRQRAVALEHEVSRLSHALRVASAAKSRFLAVAGHELRQPAQALALHVEELRQLPLSIEGGRLAARIQATSDNLAAALCVITEIARLDDGQRVESRSEDVDLHALVERVCAARAPMAQAKGLRLSYAHVVMRVTVDPSMLYGILSNLVANAIKYTDRGTVYVHWSRVGAMVSLSVEDTGRGIAQRDQPRIYDEFFRGASAGPDDAGMGLGLSLVQRLADLIGTSIRLESTLGVGSCFTLMLPMAPATVAAPRSDICTLPIRFLNGCHVVILDNDPAVAISLRNILEHWGAIVQSSADIAGLLRLLNASGKLPDMLIVDHELGGAATGFDAIIAVHRLRPENFDLPVLMMTGDLDVAIAQRAARQGLALIHKPVAPQRLKTTLAELLHLQEVPAPTTSGSPYPLALEIV